MSSVELERICCTHVAAIEQAAAVALPPAAGGPEQLHLFVVLAESHAPAHKESLSSGNIGSLHGDQKLGQHCQAALRQHLNPLFKVAGLSVVEALPRNASNKVMRRALRDRLLLQRQPKAKL